MSNYRLADLCSSAGGASKGYHDAGFTVVGIDIEPQPNYPYEFIQANVLTLSLEFLRSFDAIHASPPCQRYSQMSLCNPHLRDSYPDLIEPMRKLLIAVGVPFVIENVPHAPLINPTILCGSHFGLTTYWPEIGQKVGLQRHRGFEAHGFILPDPGKHDHSLRSVSVCGGGIKHFSTSRGGTKIARELMGINWTTRLELNEAIPPVYAEYVGSHIRKVL